MNTFTPLKKDHKTRMRFLAIAGLCILLGVASGILIYRSLTPGKPGTTPSDIRKIAANSLTVTIILNGKAAVAPDLTAQVDYVLNVENRTGAKQGIFIPALDKSIVVENGATGTFPDLIRFNTQGTYEILPSVYQPGWHTWKGTITVVRVPINTQ